MDFILIILSLIAAAVGVFTLSEATFGVGILAVACLLAIYARLAQASIHNKEIKKLLDVTQKEGVTKESQNT